MGHENGGWMNEDQRGSMKEAARKAEKPETEPRKQSMLYEVCPHCGGNGGNIGRPEINMPCCKMLGVVETGATAGQLESLVKLDTLRQEAGISAAMLRDGRAKKIIDEHKEASIGDPMGDLINANRDELLRKHEEAIRLIRQCVASGHVVKAKRILDSLASFHPMHAESWQGWPAIIPETTDMPMPESLQDHIDGWLKSNEKTTDQVRWGSFPLGMVQRWIERAVNAEQAVTAIETGMAAEFAGKESGDVVADFGVFLDHHKAKEEALLTIQEEVDKVADFAADSLDLRIGETNIVAQLNEILNITKRHQTENLKARRESLGLDVLSSTLTAGIPVSKVIYFAESDTEEAVMVADDEDDALLLIGLPENCSCHLHQPCGNCMDRGEWRFDKIGHADIGQASDVLSRVSKAK